MSKTITYPSFVIASLLVVLVFVTSTTYTQLAVAVLVYPALVYFALKVFPRKMRVRLKEPKVANQPVRETKKAEAIVVDLDKRAFLKLIGATGITFFLFSLLGRRVENSLFGRVLESGGITSPPQSSPTAGYRISEIDDNVVSYYGFINNQGGWFIMKEDPDSGTFRYAKGESDFPGSWLSRERLEYDYFHNLF